MTRWLREGYTCYLAREIGTTVAYCLRAYGFRVAVLRMEK